VDEKTCVQCFKCRPALPDDGDVLTGTRQIQDFTGWGHKRLKRAMEEGVLPIPTVGNALSTTKGYIRDCLYAAGKQMEAEGEQRQS
jgi:hypothetical protein